MSAEEGDSSERRSNPAEVDILLVEDNPNDLELCMHSFRKSGLANRVGVARDGQEALDILLPSDTGDSAPRPKLVLLDLHLPRLDGLEVLERIRSDPRTKTIPVVLLTSSEDEIDRLQAYVQGANSYLVKPVDASAFNDLVDELSLYWLKFNRSVERPQP
jgi:two-component system response regulator